ncbi:MAG: efflux RND transporter permease subunit [Myxococcales bacterium]|nr:efflux RND transporter permease subunit [Myxococcales bacterium]
MLRSLIASALNYPGLTLSGAGILLVAALGALSTLPIDVFPELNAPRVVVLTEAGGLVAEEVEQQVSVVIETTMTGIPGVRKVRSASALGLSLVWVEFDWGADPLGARQLVGERLDSVRERLPASAHPELAPMSSITGEIMLISLRADDASPQPTATPLALRSLAEFTIRRRLLSVPGVSQVVAIGGRLPELQVRVQQAELLRHQLHLGDVVSAAKAAHSTRSAGYLPNTQGREKSIVQRAQALDAKRLGDTLVSADGGAPIPLHAVADVTLGGAPRRGTAADGGHEAVVLSIQKAPGTNTLTLTAAVDEALDQLEPSLPPGVILNRHAFRQSDFIQRAVNQVGHVLRDAMIIVAGVLLLFLMNLRATFITLTALPLSLAAAVVVLQGMGLTLNVMTMGGLAVAIGELVDDAVIDVENVIRRVAENRKLPQPERRPHLQVVFEASNEIRSSVVFATLIICAVFVPLLQLEGLEGRFFQPLGLAYVAAVMASLGVALTVTPVLCLLMLKGGEKPEDAAGHGSSRFARWLVAAYKPALDVALRHRRWVLAAALAMTIGAGGLATTFGTSFLPEFSEGSLTVFLMAPPGTSLPESDRLARGVERRLSQLEGVDGVVRRTGRAERDEHAEPVWSSELDVRLALGAEKEDVRRRIDKVLADVAGIGTMVGQPIEHRLSHIMSGTPAALAISFYGDDLPLLRDVAQQAVRALKNVPGTRDVNANREALVDTLPIRYRREDLARWGLTPAAAAAQVSAAFLGATVATVRQDGREIDVVVRLAAPARQRRQQLEDLILRGQAGQLVRLSDVATVAPESAAVVVSRDQGRRKAVVSSNIDAGHNLGHVVQAAQAIVDPIARKAGVEVHYGGQFEAERRARRTLMLWGGAALAICLLLLRVALGSFRGGLLVLVNLPLALIGGVVAMYVTTPHSLSELLTNTMALLGMGGHYTAPVVSIASLIGFITLAGIAVRNGILLVNHTRHLEVLAEMPLMQAVRQGASERLLPILMTALTAILGLLPLVAAAGEPGSELLSPLAIVVLGGLVTSTLLNLFVLPVAYPLVFAHGTVRSNQHRIVRRAGGYAVEGVDQ